MSLDNLNLVELTAQEVESIDGGCEICYWVGVAVGVALFLL